MMRGRARRKPIRLVGRIGLFAFLFLLLLLVAAAGLQLWGNTRYEIASQPGLLKIPAPTPLLAFKVADPYAPPGRYYRVQLHAHTDRSFDGRISPAGAAGSYMKAGYDAIFITDHDRVTDVKGLSKPGFLVLPGSEDTVSFGTWPLGRHLLRLGVRRVLRRRKAGDRIQSAAREGGLAAPAHPNWRGNLGTGRWYAGDLLKLPHFPLLEIANPHSDDPRDLTLWHLLLARWGPAKPVWGIAVDDSHAGSLEYGWVWVKARELSERAIIDALRRGSFYASRGPRAEFGVRNGEIVADSPGADFIRFIDQEGRVVAVFRASLGAYRPRGDEGFIRVEVEADGRVAYSQPFWLVVEKR